MTDNEITALAREHADEIYKADESNPDLSICLLNEIKDEAVAEFEEMLRFLLRRYYLVEKETIRKEYKTSYNNYIMAGDARPLSQAYFNGYCFALQSLFPEIGKEVKL